MVAIRLWNALPTFVTLLPFQSLLKAYIWNWIFNHLIPREDEGDHVFILDLYWDYILQLSYNYVELCSCAGIQQLLNKLTNNI